MEQEEFPKRTFRQEVTKLLNSEVKFSHFKKTKSDKEMESFVTVVTLLDRLSEIDFITEEAFTSPYTEMYYQLTHHLVLASYGEIGYTLINYYIRDRYSTEDDSIIPFEYEDLDRVVHQIYFNSPEDLYYFYKQVMVGLNKRKKK